MFLSRCIQQRVRYLINKREKWLVLNKIFYFMLVLPLVSFPIWVGGSESGPLKLDEVLELSLKDLMDIDISIATKCKMPVSKVPEMATVLKGEDLEKRGICTVDEALDIVTGTHIRLINLTKLSP